MLKPLRASLRAEFDDGRGDKHAAEFQLPPGSQSVALFMQGAVQFHEWFHSRFPEQPRNALQKKIG